MPLNVREIGPDLWVLEEPLRFVGIECGRRMTVVRLPAGVLLVHSPSRLDPETSSWLSSLGEPRYFVCPNRIHDAHIERVFDVYPGAQVYAPPATSRSYRGLPFTGMLGDQPEPAWASAIDQVVFPWNHSIAEAVMFHRASRSLVLADLCFNIQADAALEMKLLAGLFGIYGKLAPSFDMRFVLRDRRTARQVIDRILAWDFDRVIVGHGSIVETGGHDAFERAFAWLPRVDVPSA
jgi:hypothetical protein